MKSKDVTITPMALSILLHHFMGNCTVYILPGSSSSLPPSVEKAYYRLISLDLLKTLRIEDPYEWKITDKGTCHIEALLQSPLPVQTWQSPITRED